MSQMPHPFPSRPRAHSLLPKSAPSFHNMPFDLAEQGLQLLSGRHLHAVKFRHAILDAIYTIGYQAVQMNIEITTKLKP